MLPLRPADEKEIKQLAKQVQDGLLDKDIAAIKELTADDFIYTDFNGIQHLGWLASAPLLAADLEQIVNLQLQSIALMENQACGQYTLTGADGESRPVRLTFVGPNWKLETIHLNPEAESFSVGANDKHRTTWGLIKARQ